MAEENFNKLVSRDLTSYEGSVNKIGKGAFCYADRLTSVEAPNAESVGDFAFQNCTSLTEVNIPECKDLGSYAFWNCKSLPEVEVNKATSIPNGVFSGCSNLSSVSADEATKVGIDAFHDTKLTVISLPKVKTIGKYAFKKCGGANPVEKLILPKVEVIKDNAFEESKISKAFFLSLRILGAEAFKNCTSLTEVHLNNVETIGDNAFEGCAALTDIYVNKNFPASKFITGSEIPPTIHVENPMVGGIIYDLDGITAEDGRYKFIDASGQEIKNWTTASDLETAYWVEIDNTVLPELDVENGNGIKIYMPVLSSNLSYDIVRGNPEADEPSYIDRNLTQDSGAYRQVLCGEVFELKTEDDENNELAWDPIRAYYESEDDEYPIVIFNDDGTENEKLAQIKEKFFNNEIYVRVPYTSEIGGGKKFCGSLNNINFEPGTIFDYMKRVNANTPEGDWYIGSRADLVNLQTIADAENNVQIRDWFNNNNIWTCEEEDTLRAYRWSYSDPRKDYGTFKALADLYIRNLYMDPEAPGQNPQMYKLPILAGDEEHVFKENNESAYDFSSYKLSFSNITREDFPELFENVAELDGEEDWQLIENPIITPEMCIRRAYEDCVRGVQRFATTPYVLTFGRDYYGECDDPEKPATLYKVGQTRRFIPATRTMKTITYTEEFKLDTESIILPVDISSKYYVNEDGELKVTEASTFAGAETVNPIPNCLTPRDEETITSDAMIADIYSLTNLQERYEGVDSEAAEIASEITNSFTEEPARADINADLAKYPSTPIKDEVGDYTSAWSETQASLISDYCNNILNLRGYSSQKGCWEPTAKKGLGKVILIRNI